MDNEEKPVPTRSRKSKEDNAVMNKVQVLDVLGKTYGPYAFGMVSLLIIWYGIVQPEFKNRTINFETNQKIIQSLNERSVLQEKYIGTLSKTAESLVVTAQILDRASQRLESLQDVRKNPNN